MTPTALAQKATGKKQLPAGAAEPTAARPLSVLRVIDLVVLGACSVAALVALAVRLPQHSLLKGPFPVLVPLTAYLALAISASGLRQSLKKLPFLLGGAFVLTALGALLLHVTNTVVDVYPRSFLAWTALAFFSVLVAPVDFKTVTWDRRILKVVAIPLTFASAFVLINQHYGYWTTVQSLVGRHVQGTISAQAFKSEVEHSTPPLVEKATNPAAVIGQVAPFNPPAKLSHFEHRNGSIYLPPAFFSNRRASLPVIVMLGGVPGGPDVWPDAGYAVDTTNRFEGQHHGVAPILVFADQNGSPLKDSECVDGPQGNADTYMASDVPNYIASALHMTLTPRHLFIAGFSEGGTCAITLALRHPDVYGGFLDLAGDLAPNMGSHRHSLAHLYGNSVKKMADYYPWRLLKIHHYPGMTAWFASGTKDVLHMKLMAEQTQQAQGAGIAAQHLVVNGEGHSWQFAAQAFRAILPLLCHQQGLS